MPKNPPTRRQFLQHSSRLGVGVGLFGSRVLAGVPHGTTPHRIAFLSDVQFHDVFAELSDAEFTGVPRVRGPGRIRTMASQLRSTRLCNENYFAFLAALDSAVARGARWIVLPGDCSDDGQPLHVRGLGRILSVYEARHELRFIVTFGNHDPVRPLTQPAGNQIFSLATDAPNPSTAKAPPLLPTPTSWSFAAKLSGISGIQNLWTRSPLRRKAAPAGLLLGNSVQFLSPRVRLHLRARVDRSSLSASHLPRHRTRGR
jgi:hypothetical protein